MNKGFFIADCFGPESVANVRRIVACVNACANIPIEHLEKHGHEFLGFYVQQRDVKQIIQKRDQLQNAINEIKQYIEDYPLDMGLDGFVKSVIAKIGADL